MRELGFNPDGQALEAKVRFVNEKLAAFGFPEQVLDYIRGHLHLLERRFRYPDMLRLAAWTYILAEQHRRVHTIKPMCAGVLRGGEITTSLTRCRTEGTFTFLSPDGRPICPEQWLNDWSKRFPSKRYPEGVYQYLVERGRNIDKRDVLIMGWWKDAALDPTCVEPDAAIEPAQLRPSRRWGPKSRGVAYDVWTWLATNIEEAKKRLYPSPVKFLKYLQYRSGSTGNFGLSRASFVLHVLSQTKFPIYDKNTHRAVYDLTRGGPYENHIPLTKQQGAAWYVDGFCRVFSELRGACGSPNTRLLDKALFAYGRERKPASVFTRRRPNPDSDTTSLVGSWIVLPHGGPEARFPIDALVEHLRTSGRDYIIQGQINCTLAKHPKPQSLDVWLRKNFTSRKDTKQATNEIVDQLCATGLFTVERLRCPDSGNLCKAIRLLRSSVQSRFNEGMHPATQKPGGG